MCARDSIIPFERITQAILLIRGQKVLLDSDLASLYGVETKALNRAVRRNIERFPEDFMFQLSEAEFADLRRHSGTSKRGGRRYRPRAFTEQGVAMLSSVLRSKRAAEVNVEIMRAFVRLRRMIASNDELARRIDRLEKKYDAGFGAGSGAVTYADIGAYEFQGVTPPKPVTPLDGGCVPGHPGAPALAFWALCASVVLRALPARRFRKA